MRNATLLMMFFASLLFVNVYGGDTPKFDMSKYKGIAEEALKLVKAGDYASAQKKTVELETAPGPGDRSGMHDFRWSAALRGALHRLHGGI